MGEAKNKAERQVGAANSLLADVVERVDEFATEMRDMGGSPDDAMTLVAQCLLVVLFDLFSPRLPFPGAFVNVIGALAHATVVERRESSAKAS